MDFPQHNTMPRLPRYYLFIFTIYNFFQIAYSFKKINVIYEGDDYVLSENTSNEDYLLLYDQILLEVVSDEDVQQSRSDSNAVTSG